MGRPSESSGELEILELEMNTEDLPPGTELDKPFWEAGPPGEVVVAHHINADSIVKIGILPPDESRAEAVRQGALLVLGQVHIMKELDREIQLRQLQLRRGVDLARRLLHIQHDSPLFESLSPEQIELRRILIHCRDALKTATEERARKIRNAMLARTLITTILTVPLALGIIYTHPDLLSEVLRCLLGGYGFIGAVATLLLIRTNAIERFLNSPERLNQAALEEVINSRTESVNRLFANCAKGALPIRTTKPSNPSTS